MLRFQYKCFCENLTSKLVVYRWSTEGEALYTSKGGSDGTDVATSCRRQMANGTPFQEPRT